MSLGQGTAILAFGSDTGGSVRIPASLTGNVGIKTSAGRWPTDGCVPLSPTLDTVGLLGRSVADLAYGFAALDPHLGAPEPFLAEIGRTDPSDLTIGVCENGVWDGCSPGVAEAARAAIDEMAAKGARIVALDFPEMADAYAMHLKGSVISAEFDAFLSRRLPDWIEALDPTVRRRVEDGGNITARELLDRYATLGDMTRRAHARLAEVDVLAAPTIPVTPPTFEEVAALEDHVRINRQMFRNTCPGNLLTLCGLTVPVGLDGAGMPVGLTLFGPAGADERLFRRGSRARIGDRHAAGAHRHPAHGAAAMTGLHTLTIAEIGAKLRAGTLTAGAVVEAGIARHDSYGAALGAYKLWQPDAARATAGAADAVFAAGGDLGPLQGIPVSIKDLFAVDGLPTYSGTPRRLPPEFEREGPVVAAVRRQLAPIPGKTHTVEFAYGGLGVNNHWGTPRNPWDGADHRVSGGSSSGAGVSLIEGSAHLALGSDTAGLGPHPGQHDGQCRPQDHPRPLAARRHHAPGAEPR